MRWKGKGTGGGRYAWGQCIDLGWTWALPSTQTTAFIAHGTILQRVLTHALHMGCFITGVFLRNYIIPSAFPTSQLPHDHHSHHHSLSFFKLIITSSSVFGLFWRFSFSPLGSLSTVRWWPSRELRKAFFLQMLRLGGRLGAARAGGTTTRLTAQMLAAARQRPLPYASPFRLSDRSRAPWRTAITGDCAQRPPLGHSQPPPASQSVLSSCSCFSLLYAASWRRGPHGLQLCGPPPPFAHPSSAGPLWDPSLAFSRMGLALCWGYEIMSPPSHGRQSLQNQMQFSIWGFPLRNLVSVIASEAYLGHGGSTNSEVSEIRSEKIDE